MNALLGILGTPLWWLLQGIFASLFVGGRTFSAALRERVGKEIGGGARALVSTAVGLNWLLAVVFAAPALLSSIGWALPETMPERELWILLGLVMVAAVLGVEGWRQLCRRSIQRWETRCARDDFLGPHGDDARTVGWRVARYRCRFGAAAAGSSILLIPAMAVTIRAFVHDDQLAMAAAFVPLLLWLAALGATEVVLVYVDPLAVLASRAWFRVLDPGRLAVAPTTLDRIVSPYGLRGTAESRVLADQRHLVWVAAVGLGRVAGRYPTGIDTTGGREDLLARLAAPGVSGRDLGRNVLDVLDVMIREAISGAVATSRVVKALPPGLEPLRRFGLLLAAVVGAPFVLALLPAAVELVRDLLGGP
ncbi:hypothetical protein [Nocardioides nitrophenolicus]|uniref:hypothetical protein n=1 Tax=Nocardioides nitrophenolicus TaxID=60489 RepID=UPI0019571C6F|nr:hypothetical protein [Nocardioides nitrophenolicus]MBM7518001.1 hypothetical protein [Nocardioides nitrophenolicus]